MLLGIVNFVLKTYQRILSPAIHLLCGPGYGCRFTPSCSDYARQCVKIHSFSVAFCLILKRISRCHPFSRSGYDPVPCAIGRQYLNR